MKKFLVLAAMTASFFAAQLDAFGWGSSGHDAITAIAERHLTKKAKAKVEAILGGKSIVYYAKWMDNYRHTPEYGYTTNWHVSHVDENLNPVIAEKHGRYNGDALYGLQKVMPVMENYKDYDDSTVTVNLKMLIHLIADMHCPVHIYYPNHKGYSVIIGGKRVGHHALWDSALIDNVHHWSYTEYADMLDRADKDEIAGICEGSFTDWVAESAKRCEVIYSWVHEQDQEIDQDYKNKAILLAEHQIMIAGYRLAHVLNQLFG